MIQNNRKLTISIDSLNGLHRLAISLLGIIEDLLELPEEKRRLVSKEEYKRRKSNK